MKTTFGNYIRLLRTQKGLTLTQLAAKLDLDSANLSKIENDKRVFDEKRLSKLSKIFGISVKEIREEFLTDQLGKKIYELNCSTDLLKVAEEKAEYRRSISGNIQKEKKI